LAFVCFMIGASRVSLYALAWGILATYALRCLLLTWVALRTVEQSPRHLWSVLRGPVILALCTATLVALTDYAANLHNMHAALRLLLDGTAGATGTLLALVMFPRTFVSDLLRETLSRTLSYLPPTARLVLGRIFLPERNMSAP
jgi:hydrogenase-4 membrane subunit HyfE